jgi:F0F1-type ATP synthase assembly protein I
MGGKSRKRAFGGMLGSVTDAANKAGPAAAASYGLIGAIVLFAGLGYAVDRWLETSPWFLFGGIILALIYGFAQLALAIWRRP